MVFEIAKRLQKSYGSFHGAGIYRTLEKLYGDQVSRDRINVEKQVNQFLKNNPDVVLWKCAGRKRLYKFTTKP